MRDIVHIYIASREPATLSLWKERIPPCEGIEFSTEVPPSLKADAVAMSGAFAFDRYGGRPNRYEAQIIENTRGDGFPGFVVIPPYRLQVEQPDGSFSVAPEHAHMNPSYYAVSCTLRDVTLWNSIAQDSADAISSIILDLALLEMEDPLDSSTPESVGQAIRETLPRFT